MKTGAERPVTIQELEPPADLARFKRTRHHSRGAIRAVLVNQPDFNLFLSANGRDFSNGKAPAIHCGRRYQSFREPQRQSPH